MTKLRGEGLNEGFTAQDEKTLLELQAAFSSLSAPAPSEEFVKLVMQRLPATSHNVSWREELLQYLNPRPWILATAVAACAFVLTPFEPKKAVAFSTEELVLSEIPDQMLFDTLTVAGEDEKFLLDHDLSEEL